MKDTAIIILAAGLGKRMCLDQPKVLARTRCTTLIEHVLGTTAAIPAQKTVVVTGFGADAVKATVLAGAQAGSYETDNIVFALQQQQLGTGDAARVGLESLQDFSGTVIIVYGDGPLLRPQTLQNLTAVHAKKEAVLSLVTLQSPLSNDFGRIVRNSLGKVERVVEIADCSAAELALTETNAGIYAVDASFLRDALANLNRQNDQQEYLLTDIVSYAAEQGLPLATTTITDPAEVQGVNTLADLALVNRALERRQIAELLAAGVKITDPDSLYLDPDVVVAAGVEIGPNVILQGATTIAAGSKLEGSIMLIDTLVEQNTLIKFGVRAEQAQIGAGAAVGPFAHLRPGSVLEEDVRVGNFVETKQATLHAGAKASHLTYLGDAEVGANTNLGAGTITCNYDGYTKSKTTIGPNAFIGSNSALVAPVTVGAGAIVGAGSVITKDVAPDELALARAPQVHKSGWAKRRRELLNKRNSQG